MPISKNFKRAKNKKRSFIFIVVGLIFLITAVLIDGQIRPMVYALAGNQANQKYSYQNQTEHFLTFHKAHLLVWNI